MVKLCSDVLSVKRGIFWGQTTRLNAAHANFIEKRTMTTQSPMATRNTLCGSRGPTCGDAKHRFLIDNGPDNKSLGAAAHRLPNRFCSLPNQPKQCPMLSLFFACFQSHARPSLALEPRYARGSVATERARSVLSSWTSPIWDALPFSASALAARAHWQLVRMSGPSCPTPTRH